MDANESSPAGVRRPGAVRSRFSLRNRATLPPTDEDPYDAIDLNLDHFAVHSAMTDAPVGRVSGSYDPPSPRSASLNIDPLDETLLDVSYFGSSGPANVGPAPVDTNSTPASGIPLPGSSVTRNVTSPTTSRPSLWPCPAQPMSAFRRLVLRQDARDYIEAAPKIYMVKKADRTFIKLCDKMENAVDEGSKEDYLNAKAELRRFLKTCGFIGEPVQS